MTANDLFTGLKIVLILIGAGVFHRVLMWLLGMKEPNLFLFSLVSGMATALVVLVLGATANVILTAGLLGFGITLFMYLFNPRRR